MKVFHLVFTLVHTIAFTSCCFVSCNPITTATAASGTLIGTISNIQSGYLNLTVIDPTTATITSVLYHNSELVQFNSVTPAWDSTKRTVYIPATGFSQNGFTNRVIGLQLADDLSKATLVANWELSNLASIYSIHFNSESGYIYLVALDGTSQSLRTYLLEVETGKLTSKKQWTGYVADTDGATGLASALDLAHREIAMPLYEPDSHTHWFTLTSIDSFSSFLFSHRCEKLVPYALFFDPSTNNVKAIFRDRELHRLGFGIASGANYTVQQLWYDVKEFVNVVGGIATLDSGNQVFYTLLSDSTGKVFALVTADSNTGVIKQLVEWPQVQPPPSGLLFI